MPREWRISASLAPATEVHATFAPDLPGFHLPGAAVDSNSRGLPLTTVDLELDFVSTDVDTLRRSAPQAH